MARHPDWSTRLVDYVESRRETPFAWGVHDCCRFAAGAVEAMTGTDRMAAFDYKSERAALRLISGAGSLEVLADRLLGEQLPSVAQAMRGDVVYAELENGPSIGICVGRLCAFAGLPQGVVFRPLMNAAKAWRVE